mmetsp:Transcript_77802/g.225799  ORF Transcript_77802/g.225799 Transcript_77802/m.225799 type:complete len:329 (+) Transcript_77802:114-1100(+)
MVSRRSHCRAERHSAAAGWTSRCQYPGQPALHLWLVIAIAYLLTTPTEAFSLASSSRRSTSRLSSSLRSEDTLPLPLDRRRQESGSKLPWSTSNKQESTSLPFSDIPRRDEQEDAWEEQFQDAWASWFSQLPPSPEDEFILTGDMTVLLLYAWCSHSLPNMMVNSVMNQEGVSIPEAVNTLSNNDWSTQQQILSQPVWVNAHEHPQLLEQVWKIQAEDSLMNHYGPLFSTVGVSSVVLCSCWLLAGWWHRAFCYDNTVECEPSQALVKTLDTWMTTAVLLLALLWMTTQQHQTTTLMTRADMMLIVDSCTVLMLWRFFANFLMKLWFR